MGSRLAVWLCVTGTLLAGAGCANVSTGPASGGTYRTVRAEPGHDTDAAKRHNEAGLEHLGRNELDQAADAFQRALTADADFGPAHNNLGKVYFLQKEWYKAAWEFESARRLMPQNAEPCNNLGLVLERAAELGRPAELDRAIDHYREALDLDPSNVHYRANLARAFVRRGDRTDEVRTLLEQVMEQDDRPEWRAWAALQHAKVTGQP